MTWILWHPLEGLSTGALAWLATILGFAAVLLLTRVDASRRLRTAAAPLGLASLELALTADESQRVIASWNASARAAARLNLIYDYGLIPIYTTALAAVGLMAAHWFADKDWDALSKLAVVLAWGQWVIGLVDYVTNSAMLRMLQMFPHVPESLPQTVGSLSRLKVFLLLIAIMSTLFAIAIVFR